MCRSLQNGYHGTSMGGFQPNGAPYILCGERLNQFALVIYIPDPLGCFLDELRRDLVPSCSPHAHISVLPPRPLAVAEEKALEEARARAMDCVPFDIEAGPDMEFFPATNVIYINVGKGAAELNDMYRKMNAGALRHEELYAYHPHITVAQEFDPAQLEALREEAARRWAEYKGSRVFRAESVAFVQNTLQNCWIDLAELSLGAVATIR